MVCGKHAHVKELNKSFFGSHFLFSALLILWTLSLTSKAKAADPLVDIFADTKSGLALLVYHDLEHPEASKLYLGNPRGRATLFQLPIQISAIRLDANSRQEYIWKLKHLEIQQEVKFIVSPGRLAIIKTGDDRDIVLTPYLPSSDNSYLTQISTLIAQRKLHLLPSRWGAAFVKESLGLAGLENWEDWGEASNSPLRPSSELIEVAYRNLQGYVLIYFNRRHRDFKYLFGEDPPSLVVFGRIESGEVFELPNWDPQAALEEGKRGRGHSFTWGHSLAEISSAAPEVLMEIKTSGASLVRGGAFLSQLAEESIGAEAFFKLNPTGVSQLAEKFLDGAVRVRRLNQKLRRPLHVFRLGSQDTVLYVDRALYSPSLKHLRVQVNSGEGWKFWDINDVRFLRDGGSVVIKTIQDGWLFIPRENQVLGASHVERYFPHMGRNQEYLTNPVPVLLEANAAAGASRLTTVPINSKLLQSLELPEAGKELILPDQICENGLLSLKTQYYK